MAERVEAVGARVEYARQPRSLARLDLVPVVTGMRQRGADVPTIAHLLDLDPNQVRQMLAASFRPARRGLGR
jgi:hypothetical protein